MADKISYADALKGTSTSSTQSCPKASSNASPTPAPSSSMASSNSTQSPSVASSKAVHEDCMFHGRKWMHVCQFMTNNLYKEKLLEGRKRSEFFKKICFCVEKFDVNSHFQDRAQASDWAHFFRTEISKWKKAPKTVHKLLDLFAEYEKGKDLSAGLLKFMYYFKKSYDGEFKVS